MHTGENTEGLRKITDLTRKCAILLLCLHYYVYCYKAFEGWHLTHPVVLEVLGNLRRTGLFDHFYVSKLAALVCLSVSLLGIKGKKDEKLLPGSILLFLSVGLVFYWGSRFILIVNAPLNLLAILYIGVTSVGFLCILHGGALLSRLLSDKLAGDIFNSLQETFPQEERLLTNEYSINLPAVYNLKGKLRRSWINIINPFRGILVAGTPGSGKSYFVIRHIITQHIRKGFTMFIYDFKFDDLSLIAYNTFLKNKHRYQVEPKFYVINFDNLSLTHRCNPLDPETMTDITDATESSRTIMLGLNRDWIRRTGDFFVESPINFVTAIIWFLRKYREGKYCTLPHVIELMQVNYERLFPVLRTEPEIEVLINPFVTAFVNGAMPQLEGQIGSAKITMARLASPQLYYVLSGNDFTMDLNNPKEPKIICMGNNYLKQQVYGAVLSLYTARMIKLVNRKDQLKSSLIFDEFPTIYFNAVDSLIATARSNKVSTCLGVQDFSQLRKDYGREQADVISSIVGNVISGQVTGDTAKQLSDRFGQIMQERESFSINATDTSISRSTQLATAIPVSKISSLSSGEMVGAVADNPDQKIKLKIFHSEIQNDHKSLKAEQDRYLPIPMVRQIRQSDVDANYRRIKNEVFSLIESEMERIMNTPELLGLLVVQDED
ncbi:Type IV secretory system Conjugative DNA transfer [Arachidicoccus rhizosphaerae]|uniref:Type IV secretory system Conjugative DNA transfer n=1 Tax=Arachidicoccus rhizosphaerae TaxID=551991 RepID=A0A1H3YTP6_9BACT|nr:conjugal transfer protein MobC [Arachidicoccus rhizosphaerae]SEA14780.1 Type IV secretory system Conjugative DNA transfer [Arachidicoccus rhizosphaerae]